MCLSIYILYIKNQFFTCIKIDFLLKKIILIITFNTFKKMNSEINKSIQDKSILQNNITLLEKEYNDLCKKLNEMKLTVYKTKEEIQKEKTPEQLNVELNSPLFKRGKSKYIFQNSQIPKIEGKVKYINPFIANEIISRKELEKSFDKENTKEAKEKKVDSNKTLKNKESIDKALVNLQRKKLNDLRILARDLKIKGYSTMKKEDLIKQIYNLVKSKKEKETKEIVNESNKFEEPSSRILDEKNEDEQEENLEDDIENVENDFFDDDDQYQSDIDYE